MRNNIKTELLFFESGNEIKRPINIKGSITQIRRMGKATFMRLKDKSGEIQIYLKENELTEDQNTLSKSLNLEDSLNVYGFMFKTRTGEPTLHVEGIE